MYYSGIRLEHVIRLITEFRPDEVVYVEMPDDHSHRLVCFWEFCQYYMRYKSDKLCE